MRLFQFIIIFTIIIVSNVVHANEWRYLGGKGLIINHIAIDPHNTSIIYVSTGTKIFKSTGHILAGDYQSWYEIQGNYLFKTHDYGNNWTLIADSVEGLITSIAIHPQQTNTLYVTSYTNSGESIYKSDNKGVNWSLESSFPYGLTEGLLINPYQPNILYRITQSTVSSFQKSIDSGVTWNSFSEVDNGLKSFWNAMTLSVNPQNPNIMYMVGFGDSFSGGTFGGLNKSINQGESWTALITQNEHYQIESPLINEKIPIAINPHNPDTIYIAEPIIYFVPETRKGLGELTVEDYDELEDYLHTEYTISKSTDAGKTWTIMHNLPLLIEVMKIDPHNPEIMYLGTRKGLYRSTDSGDSFKLISKKVDNRELFIQALEFDPQQPEILYIGTLNQGVYKLKMSNDCQASYDSTTSILSIPCLDVDNNEPAYTVELSKQSDNKFNINSVELK